MAELDAGNLDQAAGVAEPATAEEPAELIRSIGWSGTIVMTPPLEMI